MPHTTVHIRDELFTVEYWRNEFQSLVLKLGRNWRKEVKSIDPSIDSSVLDYVKDGRGGIDNTRRVVLALQKLTPEKVKRKRPISSRQKISRTNK
ncbi:hypothetical protein [Siphonobacter sp. SORGH_AS_0500]|uniref:hypothetical protein n=1 Tax=Siphonobacter sp. SORGH_AS_0500 TaxID=1864824 RepID=UPI0028642484|nr:hypothetical protein [Siphonobacter sp. SORGH_AS_0500]MDR6195206.1 hypothetical protein [Siphonobacter sp. SORGH_AS_0500]